MSLDDRERRDLRRKARVATLRALQVLGGEARRDAILTSALEVGGFTPRELAAAAPDAAAGKFDRMVDHQLAWALTNLKRDGLVENPRRGVWALAGAALEPPEMAIGARLSKGRIVELQVMPYSSYLRTPEWRRTRAAALLRAGNCCSLDVTHSDALDVHHRTYARLGAELASDLVVLCRPCHQLHHMTYGRPRREAEAGSKPWVPAESESQTPTKRSLLQRLLAR